MKIKRNFWRGGLLLGLVICLTGCVGLPAVTSETGNPPAQVVDPLPANKQDDTIKPQLVWLPRDDASAFWWTGVVSGGWVSAGQYYMGSEGMAPRLDYYGQDGRLKWSYQGASSAISSDCYLCAALLPDGALIAGGRHSDGVNPEVGTLSAFSAAGDRLWEIYLEAADQENLGLSVVQCLITAGGRILAVINSTHYNDSNGSQPSIVVCLDSSGKQIWRCDLDFAGMTYNQYAVLDDDGGLYLALYGYANTGSQMSAEYNWLLRISPDGQEIWRRPLQDATYQYEVRSMARDSDGNLYLSCAARYVGIEPTPTIPAESKNFRDRYRFYAWNPAALLKLDADGNILGKRFLNGEFGAYGGQVRCEGLTVYWLSTLTDDIVAPYIFMSTDHRSITHQVLAILDPDSQDFRYHQFATEESAGQLVQRIEDGKPVLIGVEPFIPPKEWETETFIPGQ